MPNSPINKLNALITN